MMTRYRPLRLLSFSCSLALLLIAARAAAEDAGTIAAIDGVVQIQRAGAAIPAVAGTVLVVGDEIRTGAGRIRIVLRDGSVLNVGTDSTIVIVQQVVEPDTGRLESLFRLVKGAVRALVGENYGSRGASYQIETATAVIGVRGTEFVIAYNSVTEVTEVVGVTGKTSVHSVLDRTNRGVVVSAQELTTVTRGKFPTSPVRLTDAAFRQYIEGLDFIGGGRRESMSGTDPWATGGSIPPEDRADAIAGPDTVDSSKVAAVPQTDIQIRGDLSTLLEQPPAAVSGGGLGIHF